MTAQTLRRVAEFGAVDPQGLTHADLLVKGIHCPNCIRTLEGGLGGEPGISAARVNFSTSRMHVAWDNKAVSGQHILDKIGELGFEAMPVQAGVERTPEQDEAQSLLIALAVAGFASANIMLLSVAVWAGFEMGPATRTLMHWISGLIALPAVAFSGRPFFRSAIGALRARRVNMDVPISLAVILACALSIAQVQSGAHHTFFDAAVMLLFFLLIGRYLDLRMRARARSAVSDLMLMQRTNAFVLGDDETTSMVPADQVRPGDRLLVPQGERVPVDAEMLDPMGEFDVSMLTGETMPERIAADAPVYAGSINLSAPVRVRAAGTADKSVIAEIVRLLENAEQSRAAFVRLADKAAAIYVPAVHTLAALTFVGWMLWGGGWALAATNAIAVLIITCPCALGLAVPVVQVVASGFLFRRGILLKSADGLERLAEVDTIVFDKTGTLTKGKPVWVNRDQVADADMSAAAQLARVSRHPLSRALAEAAGPGEAAENVTETPGFGLEMPGAETALRLGSASWCGAEGEIADHGFMSLWFRADDGRLIEFRFDDEIRDDAARVIGELQAEGYRVELLSGDRAQPVRRVAKALGIQYATSQCLPGDKIERLETLAAEGRKVLMVGDGLNDAPSLAAAHASMSPASAADISQTAASFVFQGERLCAVPTAIKVSRNARRLILQNFGFAAAYNMVAVPLAVFGFVTPLVAALAMSGSSIVVTLNALRLNLTRKVVDR